MKKCRIFAGGSLLFLASLPVVAWSNRGHRLINRVAAQSLPADVPSFLKTAEAQSEISYLGPEPDRWTQRGLEPELASATGPDHFFRIELAKAVGPLPRNRYGFLQRLGMLQQERPEDASDLQPQRIGTLPWEVEEIFERLEAAFHAYRIANAEFSPSDYTELAPITRQDLPDIQATILFYAGWLGHYVGDGCMPLHDSVNIAGWTNKQNPAGYTTKGSIHHDFEMVADDAIEAGQIAPSDLRPNVSPARRLSDAFVDTLAYLQTENQHTEGVYRLNKQGEMKPSSTKARAFIVARMGEGASMLRDMIYTAWLDSADLTPTSRPPETNILNR